jgi:hypothetical protein
VQRQHWDIKLEMIQAYGGECSCPGCNVTEPAFLTLDHSFGNGSEERKTLGISGGYKFYIFLKAQGWPKNRGLRLMCWNCNCARGKYGKCPHERTGQLTIQA